MTKIVRDRPNNDKITEPDKPGDPAMCVGQLKETSRPLEEGLKNGEDNLTDHILVVVDQVEDAQPLK